MSQTPELAELIELIVNQRLDQVSTNLIAKIVSFNSTKQTVDVQPLVKESYDDESGDRQVVDIPIITDVPVQVLGGGGYAVTFPLAVGDQCLLCVSQHAIDKWLVEGTNNTLDPLDDRKFDITDAVAIVGVRNNANVLTSNPTNGMRVGRDGEAQHILITETDIQVGGTSVLALKSDVDDIKTFLALHFDVAAGHTHSLSGVGPPATGAGSGSGFSIPTATGATYAKG